ncbi:MAG: HEAT repeat domain-containing protein [Phycisphaeraceae bacterium]|nr:MAG: HEAT repeat domain-containing protein [Phycisphaeraceae bacterium]
MPTPRTPRPSPNRSAASLIGAGLLILAAGCTELSELNPQSESILDIFRQPSPAEAVNDAQNPYDADKRARGTLLLATADFASEPLYVELFVTGMSDTEASVRAASCKALARNGGPTHAPLMIKALADPDVGVRAEAARALQRIHSPDAILPLINALREPDSANPTQTAEDEPEVRAEAALALGQYRRANVLQALIAALRDSRLAVNRNTLASLRTLTGQDFGYDPGAWLAWLDSTSSPFAGAAVYLYPAYNRDWRWYEYFPFVPKPPVEAASTPAGLPIRPQ